MPTQHVARMTVVMLVIAACSAAAQTPYHLVDQWRIGGNGGWDYLMADAPAHRLYATHGTRVEVIDTVTGKSVGAVTDLKGSHGVALDEAGGFGYISDGVANAIVIFDRQTFAPVAKVSTGTNPDGIIFEPTTKTVWAFNGRSNNATVVDTARRAVIATIALPGKPEFPQVDRKGNVFVNIEDTNNIVRMNAVDHTVTATWALPGCTSPSGMAFDPARGLLFSVCDGNKMAVTDSNTGKQVALAGIGSGPDAAAYDAKDGLAFSSNGEGTISVIDTGAGYKTVQVVETKKGARTMTYDPLADRLYLSSAEYGPTPAPTKTAPRPRPQVLPGTYTILVVGRK